MAVYNEIQVGRYVRFLQKFLQIKGRQPAPLQFTGDLGATWSLFHGAENRYLEGWNPFGFGVTVAAVAANNNGAQLRNPAGSNVVAVITKITVQADGAAANFLLSGTGATPTTVDLANAFSGGVMDARSNPNSVCVASYGTINTDFVASLARGSSVLNGSYDFISSAVQEIPLLPGAAIRVRNLVVNDAFGFGFFWRERLLEESERK